MLVVSSGGQLGLLDALKPTLRRLHVRLFINDALPVQDFTADDFLEPTYPQYARAPLASWEPVRPTADGHAMMRHAVVRFPAAGVNPPVPIIGVWIADAQGRVWWSERLATAPFSLHEGGDDFTFLPQLVLRGFH